MAILIKSLPVQKTTSAKPYLYADLHLDLQTAYTTNNKAFNIKERKDIRIDYDVSAIRNSILNILTTSPGEKILNPGFGIDLRYYLFDEVSIIRANELGSLIYTLLSAYEPRITIRHVQVIPDPDNSAYSIDIFFTIPEFTNEELFVRGTLNSNNGYIFSL